MASHQDVSPNLLIRIAPVLPSLALFLVYWPGLDAWFQQDDFAWLGLKQRVSEGMSLGNALFAPMAQGTVRTLSERLYFLCMRSLFDLNGFPFHLVVFSVQVLSLTLMTRLLHRVTQSLGVAIIASLVWTTHSSLAWPLTWVSAFNQALCSLVFILMVSLFERYERLRSRTDLIALAAVFLLGFGVLELNIVLPGILLLFSRLFAPTCRALALALLFPSGIFYLVHGYFAPKATEGLYAVALDQRIFNTLSIYVGYTVWPASWKLAGDLNATVVQRSTVVLACVIFFGFVWLLCRRDRIVLFGIGWYLLCLGPYLLVPNHVSDYYLFVPLIGFATALAQLVCVLWQLGTAARLASGLFLCSFVLLHGMVGHLASARACADSQQAEMLVTAVKEIGRRHPGKSILLSGITDTLFWNCFYDHPFLLNGQSNVYLTPDTAQSLLPTREIKDFSAYSLPVSVALNAIESSNAVVYRVLPNRLQSYTTQQTKLLRELAGTQATPATVLVGDQNYSYLLRGDWHRAEDGYRWMGRKVQVALPMPASLEPQLELLGFCSPEQVKLRAFELSLYLDGEKLSSNTVSNCASPILLTKSLPRSLKPGSPITLSIQVDHTVRIGEDERELGIAVQKVSVR